MNHHRNECQMMTQPAKLLGFTILSTILFALAPIALADSPQPSIGPGSKTLSESIGRGVSYLAEHGQAEDGSLSKFMGTGPTSLGVAAMLRNGRSPQDPAVANGLKYLESCVQKDGGIYGMGGHFGNYETCVAIMCFQEARRAGTAQNEVLTKAEAYVRGLQWNENRDKEPSDYYYGGAGYGGKSRPDLSNTAFLIDALKSCGAKEDDKAIQKSLAFVSRCQNLESPHNTTPFAAKENDGGFYYTCTIGRMDKERMTPAGGLRSYGSMTYSGLKSMVYAGLKKDDPRVKAAMNWIRQHYDVKTNPGMGAAGLYYYYLTFAKAMDAIDEDIIVDAKGVKHDWRKELAEELIRRQQPDGSWINTESSKWMESDPNLATAFALLSLSYCRPPAGEKP